MKGKKLKLKFICKKEMQILKIAYHIKSHKNFLSNEI
jgi:hypothetical protein